MTRYAWVAVSALTLAACSDGIEPTMVDPSLLIAYAGNETGIWDQHFKFTYEDNNWYSRRGEGVYRYVSDANFELAFIFDATTRTREEAIAALDRFIAKIQEYHADGNYSACAATSMIARAEWLRGKLEAGSFTMTGVPALCHISPVGLMGYVTAAQVVLSIDDPWHYTQDHNKSGVQTYTYFKITLPGGGIVYLNPDGTQTTLAAAGQIQYGRATVTFTDANTAMGDQVYSVQQCDTNPTVGCSTAASITINRSAMPVCVHDNRDGLYDPKNTTKPKCDNPNKKS